MKAPNVPLSILLEAQQVLAEHAQWFAASGMPQEASKSRHAASGMQAYTDLHLVGIAVPVECQPK